MTFPVLAAMITDLSTEKTRQESFSLLYLATNVGISIGPFIAGILFNTYIRWIFWGQALSFLLTALIVIFFIRDTTPDAAKQAEPDIHLRRAALSGSCVTCSKNGVSSEEKLFTLFFQSPFLICFIFCIAVLMFAYIQVDFVLPLQMKDVFGIAAGSRYFGYMSACNGIVVVLFSPILMLLTKRLRPLTNMAIASVLYTVGFGLYAFTHHLLFFILLVAVWTSGEILISTNSGVYIAAHSPETHRARFQSLFEFA